MGRKLNLILVEKTLRDRGFTFFTPFDFAGIFETSPISSQKFLERYTKKGVFLRVKNGLYLFEHNPRQDVILANKIYFPSYVSLDYSLSYYGVIPETVYSMTSVTTKPTREFTVANRSYEYRKIKKEAYTGYAAMTFDGQTGLMAEPEKALADYLYFVSLGERTLNDRLSLRKINLEKVKIYGRLFKRPGLERIINDLNK